MSKTAPAVGVAPTERDEDGQAKAQRGADTAKTNESVELDGDAARTLTGLRLGYNRA